MSETREKIAKLGEDFIRAKGYNAFSYHDIAQNLGVKNAAIHYHYPSKEDLGCSVIRETQQKFEDMIADLESKNCNEWKKLDAFLRVYLKNESEEKICIVGALSPAYNTLGSTMQQELEQMVGRILAWVTTTLEEGRRKGLFAFEGEAQIKAVMVITNMLGGLQLARVSDKVDFSKLYKAVLADLKP